jgi:hypothetical protein
VSLDFRKIAPALASKVFEAAGNYGLEQEALAALMMREIPARLAIGDDVFEVGEPWAKGQGAFVTLAFFDGEGDARLGRYRPGDWRVYLVAAASETRAMLAAAGATPFMVATVGESRATRRFYDEESFVDLIAREWVWIFRTLQAPFAGADDEDEDADYTTCEECHADTRVWTRDDPADEDSEMTELDVARFCANCGAQIPVTAQVVPS